MTRSKGVGRGRAAGSRRALRQANAERQRRARAKTAPHAPDGKPTARPHLQPFQTPEHMAELRRRRAEKRPAAVAARQAHEKRERQAREAAAQAERERLAREAERHRNRPITILTASRWLGESPVKTLTRVLRGQQPTAVTMEDGSTRVRAGDVQRMILADARRPPREFHTPSTRPCGIGDGQVLSVRQWALIFGSAPSPYIVVPRRVVDCPQCGRALEAGRPMDDSTVPYRCSMSTRCDYQAVRGEERWLTPPAFWGPWSPPVSEHDIEHRVEAVTFADARAYFADPEAELMPDFEIPAP
jgi:hypothetical protein